MPLRGLVIALFGSSGFIVVSVCAAIVFAAVGNQQMMWLAIMFMGVLSLLVFSIGLAVALTFMRERKQNATSSNNLKSRLLTASSELARMNSELLATKARVERLETKQQAVDSSPNRIGVPNKPQRDTGADYGAELVEAIGKLAKAQGVSLSKVMSVEQAALAIGLQIRRRDALDAVPYLRAFPSSLDSLSLNQARTLLSMLRKAGFLDLACCVLEHLAVRFDKPNDRRALEFYRSEIEVYEGRFVFNEELPEITGSLQLETVLHLVGKALPFTQSGYTLRTQYTAQAQKLIGITPVVVAQSGSTDSVQRHTETYEHNGIRYYLLGGKPRAELPWGEWLSQNIRAFADIVSVVRPAIIHAHSDFINSIIAQCVGKAYGIPVVNETRGFWEESWLSRTAHSEGWPAIETVEGTPGLPDLYTLRQAREVEYRSTADVVFTLAEVMRSHVASLAEQSGMPVKSIELAPNAVDPAQFPIVDRNKDLLELLGIDPDASVIGYITSVVEYEGIDVLLKSFAEVLSVVQTKRAVSAIAPKEAPSGFKDALGVAPLALASESDEVDEHFTDLEHEAYLADEWIQAVARRIAKAHQGIDSEVLEGIARELLEACEVSGLVHLLIVGDGAEKARLEQLAADLEVAEHVTFTGRVPHDQILEYYGAIDIFVVPRKSAAVTELVTPLKPFEAMSTGRPCVFSDVAALAEIATDSGAARLFRAGDQHHLALTLLELLRDSSALEALGRSGASWVRRERTWLQNALRYVPAYERLGLNSVVPQSLRDFLELNSEGIDARALVRAFNHHKEPSQSAWWGFSRPRQTARDVMEAGWAVAGSTIVEFTAGMDWDGLTRANRSLGFKLHSWEFLDAALSEIENAPNSVLLQWMLETAEDWWRFSEHIVDSASMAWYDMSLSQRMPRLARLVRIACKNVTAERCGTLLKMMIRHVDECLSESAFNANNNHGFYTAAAGLDFCDVLPGIPLETELRDVSTGRMAQMALSQFAPDGGHLEHSPSYHLMLLKSFRRAINAGLVNDAEALSRIERAGSVLGWMIQPDGRLVQFGDTEASLVLSATPGDFGAHAEFISSDGAIGSPEQVELLVLDQSGYAFVRSPQPAAPGERLKSSYLAFSAGFHSRAHKHADDLNFVWFDRQCELLVDSGRFGYVDLLAADAPARALGFYYSSPERQYVESTIAHNTLELDGAMINRRRSSVGASRLEHCAQNSGLFELNGTADHGHYRHSRQLRLSPGESLEVLDTVVVVDGGDHSATLWFNLDGALELLAESPVAFRLPGQDFVLEIISEGDLVMPVRGQVEPLRGWRSRFDRETEPTWNLGFTSSFVGSASILTQFVLKDLDSYLQSHG